MYRRVKCYMYHYIGVHRHTIAGLDQIESIGKADIFRNESVEIVSDLNTVCDGPAHEHLTVCEGPEQPDVK